MDGLFSVFPLGRRAKDVYHLERLRERLPRPELRVLCVCGFQLPPPGAVSSRRQVNCCKQQLLACRFGYRPQNSLNPCRRVPLLDVPRSASLQKVPPEPKNLVCPRCADSPPPTGFRQHLVSLAVLMPRAEDSATALPGPWDAGRALPRVSVFLTAACQSACLKTRPRTHP